MSLGRTVAHITCEQCGRCVLLEQRGRDPEPYRCAGGGCSIRAILTRLQGAESDLARLRTASTVIDMKAVLALLPAAIRRYRAMVANLEDSGIDVSQAREVAAFRWNSCSDDESLRS